MHMNEMQLIISKHTCVCDELPADHNGVSNRECPAYVWTLVSMHMLKDFKHARTYY